MAASDVPEVLDLTNAEAKRVCLHFRQQRKITEPCYYTTLRVDSDRSFLKIFCRDPVVRKSFARQINEFLGRKPVLEGEEAATNGSGLHAADQNNGSCNGRHDECSAFRPINGASISPQEPQNAAAESGPGEHGEFAAGPSSMWTNGGSEFDFGALGPLSVTNADPEEREEQAPFDAFTCPVVTENIEKPPKELEELFLLRPYAAMFIHRADITRGTSLQAAAWPDLFSKRSMALIGPRGCGKTFAYLPVAMTLCLSNTAVVLTVRDKRTKDLDNKLSYYHLAIDVTRPPSKIYDAKKQLLICDLHWFYCNRRNITPSVLIFDKLDRMVESALDVTCVEVAESCPDIPLIATARKVTPQLEQTLELMNITSSVMVPTPRRNRDFQEYLVSIDDARENSRYQVLVSILRNKNLEEPILIFFNDETEVDSMYAKLDTEAHNGTVPFSTLHNLREKIEDERNLYRKDLNEGMPGVYLACLQDHTWLFTTSSVATIINFRPPDCAQAYRYRRERLRSNGKILTIVRSLDVNVFPEDLFHLLSNLKGYDGGNPCIDKLRKAFEDERELRNMLRFKLLS